MNDKRNTDSAIPMHDEKKKTPQFINCRKRKKFNQWT